MCACAAKRWIFEGFAQPFYGTGTSNSVPVACLQHALWFVKEGRSQRETFHLLLSLLMPQKLLDIIIVMWRYSSVWLQRANSYSP
mmetsp:Transcript_29861/g.91657  ORF Transcript_29861/g.91657 Transcript_29861/m.91657 type:complete len:85 (-) Transcript_29861:683-937(-)